MEEEEEVVVVVVVGFGGGGDELSLDGLCGVEMPFYEYPLPFYLFSSIPPLFFRLILGMPISHFILLLSSF